MAPRLQRLTAHLAGADVQSVVVDGARLPVLHLHEAGAFRRTAVLRGLGGRGPALSLQTTDTL